MIYHHSWGLCQGLIDPEETGKLPLLAAKSTDWCLSARWRLLHLDPLWSFHIFQRLAHVLQLSLSPRPHMEAQAVQHTRKPPNCDKPFWLQVSLRPVSSQFLPLLRLHGAPSTQVWMKGHQMDLFFSAIPPGKIVQPCCCLKLCERHAFGIDEEFEYKHQDTELVCKSPKIKLLGPQRPEYKFCMQSCFSLRAAELAAAYPQPLEKGRCVQRSKIQMHRPCAPQHIYVNASKLVLLISKATYARKSECSSHNTRRRTKPSEKQSIDAEVIDFVASAVPHKWK